jgi:hypothetical protein
LQSDSRHNQVVLVFVVVAEEHAPTHSRANPRDLVNELVTPNIPFSIFAVVFTRPASGMTISTWARETACTQHDQSGDADDATHRTPEGAKTDQLLTATPKPNRSADEADQRVRRSNRAISEALGFVQPQVLWSTLRASLLLRRP